MIKEILINNKLKATNQRIYVLDTINQLGYLATLKNIIENCSNTMNNSTIYRILELFSNQRIIEKKVNYENEIYYCIKEKHSHYFTCIICHKKEKIAICPINDIEYKLESEKGYKILNHTVELEGICKNCQNKKER